MREEDVTSRLARHLSAHGWTVVSAHSPGSQGGLYILRTPRPAPPTKGAVVLDLLAVCGATCLLVESKSRFFRRDATKLLNLVRDRAYQTNLRERLGTAHKTDLALVPALAIPEGKRFANPPEGVLVLTVGLGGISLAAGHPVCALPGLTTAPLTGRQH